MRVRYQVAGMTSILLVIAIGLLWSTRTVSAAADGKITGTVKLDGTAPHMKGIDMSKDPFCVKQHENSPAHLENVIAGPGGGLQNVVLYISEGLSGAEAGQVDVDVSGLRHRGDDGGRARGIDAAPPRRARSLARLKEIDRRSRSRQQQHQDHDPRAAQRAAFFRHQKLAFNFHLDRPLQARSLPGEPRADYSREM